MSRRLLPASRSSADTLPTCLLLPDAALPVKHAGKLNALPCPASAGTSSSTPTTCGSTCASSRQPWMAVVRPSRRRCCCRWHGCRIMQARPCLPLCLCICQIVPCPALHCAALPCAAAGVLALPLIKNKKTVNPRDSSSPPVFQLVRVAACLLFCLPARSARPPRPCLCPTPPYPQLAPQSTCPGLAWPAPPNPAQP